MQHPHGTPEQHEHTPDPDVANHDDHGHGHGHHPQGIRGRGGFIISGLTGGHGVFHWFTQSLIVLLPEIREAFALSGGAVGGISTVRELVSGLVTLPGGIIADALRKYWGLVLALCMAFFGIGWLIIGLAPSYVILLVGMGVVALAASIWHLPAMASLSHHFSHRRGTALSFHGVGGQVGDVIAPPVTVLLLGILTWQQIISIYAAVPIFLAFLVYWAFKNIGRTGEEDTASRGDQWETSKRILLNPILWIVAFVGGIRGMAFIGLITFFPLFLDDIGLSPVSRGFHFGALLAVGIVATPIVGYLSDKLGRKIVLVPGLILLAVMAYFLGRAEPGILLIAIVLLMGTFLYGDQPILTALALDVVGDEVPTTVLGILSLERFVLSAASPLIAGWLYDNGFTFGGIELGGPEATFTYVAALFLIGAVILLVTPLPRPARSPGHH
ncbi:MAG: MFS transporter [Chloroflexi bacterium]|nr:MFS transporter [Chloroflexota bacterium]